MTFQHQRGRAEKAEVPAQTQQNQRPPEMRHVDATEPHGGGKTRQSQAHRCYAPGPKARNQCAGEETGRVHGDDMPLQAQIGRSEEHTSELQSLMRISYAVFRLKTKKTKN